MGDLGQREVPQLLCFKSPNVSVLRYQLFSLK